MTRDPYEDPLHRGPECNGLSDNASFDLAKQLRITARNRRLASKLGGQRQHRGRVINAWGSIGSVAIIGAGLALLVWTVHLWSR